MKTAGINLERVNFYLLIMISLITPTLKDCTFLTKPEILRYDLFLNQVKFWIRYMTLFSSKP